MTIVFGVLLIVLGVIAFVATGAEHKTALIPSGFGAVLAALGALATAKPNLRMHVMHGAVLVGILGFAGSVGGAVKLLKWAGGTEPERRPAVIAQTIMAVLMVAFVALCVKSFIAARKARRADLPGTPSV